MNALENLGEKGHYRSLFYTFDSSLLHTFETRFDSLIFKVRNMTIDSVSPLESDHNFFARKSQFAFPLEESTIMSITRSLGRQNRCEGPLVPRMTTLFKRFVNIASPSSTSAETKNTTGFKSERVVQMQRTVIFIYGDYGSVSTESVRCLDPDERVIAAPKSSSWLSSPFTIGFIGGVHLIGVGQTLREKVELR